MKRLLCLAIVLAWTCPVLAAEAEAKARPKDPAMVAFREAAEAARDEKKIGVLDIIRCRAACRNWNCKIDGDESETTVGQAISDEIVAQAVKAGKLKPEALYAPEEINWDGLAEFIKTIMPVILAFIQALIPLFSWWHYAVPSVMVAACIPLGALHWRRKRKAAASPSETNAV